MRMLCCALFLDMGLGKTIILLTAIAKLQDRLRIGRVLILAPKRVVRLVWRQEAAKWNHTKDLRVVACYGKLEDRLAAIDTPHDILLINYENVPWLLDERFPGRRKRGAVLPWDWVVCDESSKMKSPSSRRFKLLKRRLSQFKRRTIMSATPVPESYENLWSQMFLVDKGRSLGDFVTHFRSNYFDINRYSFEKKLKPGAAKIIEDRIAPLCLSMKAEDHLTMPKLVFNEIKVTLPPKAMEQYTKFRREMYLKFERGQVEAFNSATVAGKCRQLAAGFIYDEDKVAHWVHTEKLDALEDLIDDAQGNPLIVCFEWHAEAAALRKRWPKAPMVGGGAKAIDEDKLERDWNAGKIPLLFANPQSIGHGVTFQYGGHILVWLTQPWSGETNTQTIGRIYRQGQTRPVQVHAIRAQGTTDQLVADGVRLKGQTGAQLHTALRSYAYSEKGPCEHGLLS